MQMFFSKEFLAQPYISNQQRITAANLHLLTGLAKYRQVPKTFNKKALSS